MKFAGKTRVILEEGVRLRWKGKTRISLAARCPFFSFLAQRHGTGAQNRKATGTGEAEHTASTSKQVIAAGMDEGGS